MKKNYRDEFIPHLTYSTEENKFVCSTNYIEIGRECYKYQGLKDKKNDILVYSAILAGLNNPLSETFSYSNNDIANRLALDSGTIRRSIRNIKDLGLMLVSFPSENKRNIKVLIDLRYPTKEIEQKKPKKDFIKVYDRIFYYPLIAKPMVHVYSYLLSLTSMPNYKGYILVSYKKIGVALGYSKNQVIKIIKDMENIGLIKVIRKANQKYIMLNVDFSKKQPEETDYEERYNKLNEQCYNEREQRETPTAKIEHEIQVLENQQEKLKKKIDRNTNTQDEFMLYSINQEKLEELKEQLNDLKFSLESCDYNVAATSVKNENQHLIESAPDSSQNKPAKTRWNNQCLFEDEDEDW